MDTRAGYNVLSICSGYGGLELGLDAAMDGRTRTVCYIEAETGVASILAACMENGTLDKAPVWSDLRTFDPEPWRGKVDILAGGFPCQPHSVAGNKLGEDDSRELSGEVIRIADGLGLPVLFLENVPGICQFYWDSIRPQLREMGYSVAEGLFTAAETGAPHKRERLFILAHADSDREIRDQSQYRKGRGIEQNGEELADTEYEGLQGVRQSGQGEHAPRPGYVPLYPPGPNDHEGWAYMLNVMPEAQPTFCRMADGATTGVERRLRSLGNGVVPAVAAIAFRTLAEKVVKEGQTPQNL